MASKKINVNTQHLKKGDPLPPYNGKLRVYNMRYCPFAHRTMLTLIAKGVDFEVVNINLRNKPEWFASKNPLEMVPVLEVEENVTIYESLITVEYLDEVYTNRPLLSKDPVRRAQDKVIVQTFLQPVTAFFYNTMLNPDTVTEAHKTAFLNTLFSIQGHLKSRGTKFLHGNEPGYVDYMIWPWLERIWNMRNDYPELKLDADKFKLLIEYFGNMFKDPAVSQYAVPPEILKTFIGGYKTGTVVYDMLLEA